MTENFKVVKNKYKLMAVIAAVALGVFCGVIAACSLLLAFKLSEIEFLWVYYVLIGIGVAACCAVPFYFLLRPNDKKLAVKLDNQYSLNQKVQTMVEFAEEGGALVTMQREQADEALAVAAKSHPDFKGLLKFIFIPVLAIAIACVSIAIPAKKTAEVLPGFTLTDTQRKAVNNLISDVNSSELSDELKTSTATALSDMLEKLEEVTLQSKMKSTVISTIKGVDSIIAEANSYYPLYKTLKENELTQPFAVASAQGVAYYKYTASKAIKSLDAVNDQYNVSDDIIVSMLSEWKDGVTDMFYQESEGTKQLLGKQDIVELIEAYSDAFKDGLERVEFAGENDALLTLVAEFADDILTINPAYGAEGYVEEFSMRCKDFINPSAADALSVQTYNCLMDEFIRNRTAEIFGLKASEIGLNSNVVPEYIDSGNSGGGSGGNGGGGSGDINFGSNDLVLNPDAKNEDEYFVEYSTILPHYRDKIDEIIREYKKIADDENATEEEKAEAKYVLGELSKYMQQYFDRLEGSITD